MAVVVPVFVAVPVVVVVDDVAAPVHSLEHCTLLQLCQYSVAWEYNYIQVL